MIDFLSVFSTPQAWVELATLIFLEMVLGIDNLVFIAITTDRLPDNKKHIGRRLGLLGALCLSGIGQSVTRWKLREKA